MVGSGIVMILLGSAFPFSLAALHVWSLVLLMRAAARVPDAHRRMRPGMVFLCPVPVFRTARVFWTTSRISPSMESTSTERGVDRGDCVRGKGLAFAIIGLMSSVPALVRLIIDIGGPDAGLSRPETLLPPGLGCFSGLAMVASLVFWVLFGGRVRQLDREPAIPMGPMPDHPPSRSI